jgi:hypothetical protein
MSITLSKDWFDHINRVRPYVKDMTCPDLDSVDNEELYDSYRTILNTYEALAAGVRLGDISEDLFKASEKTVLIKFYGSVEEYIRKRRQKEGHETYHEHIEWLINRWKRNPPSMFRRFVEDLHGRPLPKGDHWKFFFWRLFLLSVICSAIFGIVYLLMQGI